MYATDRKDEYEYHMNRPTSVLSEQETVTEKIKIAAENSFIIFTDRESRKCNEDTIPPLKPERKCTIEGIYQTKIFRVHWNGCPIHVCIHYLILLANIYRLLLMTCRLKHKVLSLVSRQ
jgi:hypothetical protein